MSSDLFGRPIRLCYFETVLFTEGRANTADLVDEFGISRPHASADINEYFRIAGPVAEYCASSKAYILNTRRKPALLARQSFPLFLASLRALQDLTKPSLNTPEARENQGHKTLRRH